MITAHAVTNSAQLQRIHLCAPPAACPSPSPDTKHTNTDAPQRELRVLEAPESHHAVHHGRLRGLRRTTLPVTTCRRRCGAALQPSAVGRCCCCCCCSPRRLGSTTRSAAVAATAHSCRSGGFTEGLCAVSHRQQVGGALVPGHARHLLPLGQWAAPVPQVLHAGCTIRAQVSQVLQRKGGSTSALFAVMCM